MCFPSPFALIAIFAFSLIFQSPFLHPRTLLCLKVAFRYLVKPSTPTGEGEGMSRATVTSDVHRYPVGWGWRGSGCVLLAQAESNPPPAIVLISSAHARSGEKTIFRSQIRSLHPEKKRKALFKVQTFNSLVRPSWQVRMA